MDVEQNTRTAIRDATSMVEVAFNIVSYSMSDTSEALTEADLRDMDDFLIKLFWAYRKTERMYCEILLQIIPAHEEKHSIS